MVSDLIKWILGIFFALILGAYSYTAKVDYSTEDRINTSENRVMKRIDRLEDNLLKRLP